MPYTFFGLCRIHTELGEILEYLHVGRVLLGLVKGIQGLCGGKVAVTETNKKTS